MVTTLPAPSTQAAPDLAPAPQPRLTRLEVQGFKSFATRTVFAFEPGITAIVGPNGSGKSNVADAIRWVLGEQGSGALRAKRTEDVIFAGGHGRAPAGVAEATLVFDNGDRWLPIDVAEVAVTRRADRSGENQYLINGRRVRLKDVAHLTASLGQSHVVVGQGLVDAALSQRPEERRGLFEHAADLAGLRLKAAETERNLAETDANSARLRDLLMELEPRLKSLERAARQAREWQGTRDALDAAQRTHFRALLREAIAAVEAARAATDVDERALRQAREEVDRLQADAAAAAVEAERARAALRTVETRRQELTDRHRRLTHERDLTAERVAALARRGQDMADTRAGLETQAATVTAELARLAAELRQIEAAVTTSRGRLAAAQAAAKGARDRRGALERQVAATAKRRGERERRAADLARRRALLDQRRETDAAERASAAEAHAERGGRIEALLAELAEAEAAVAEDAGDATALAERQTALAAEVDRARQAATDAAKAAAEGERRIAEARGRLDGLRRLHESGAGLYAGVRETLRAARGGELDGVLGTAAELIEVPSDLETAVEVALGGHLQDVVVRRWVDAERAIAHLKQTGAGRATFQPIETVRPTPSGRRLPDGVLARPGVLGVAAGLVRSAAEVRAVVEALLGRTLIVDDLATARSVLPALPPGWSAVTLGGEIARAGGSVTGGAAVRESGVLGRERELRELPVALERLERERDAAIARRAAAEAEQRRLEAERGASEAARAARLAAGAERRRHRDRLAAWLEELRREQAVTERHLAALAERSAATDAEALALAAESERLAAEETEVAAGETRLRDDLRGADVDVAGTERAVAAASQEMAALDERLRAERRREAGLRAQERAVAEELALRGERTAALDRERALLAAAHDRVARELEEVARALAAVAQERGPLEARLGAAERDAERLREALDSARERALDRERAASAAALSRERSEGDLRVILRRIADELDLAEPERLLDDADGEPPDGDAAAREREIARLKEKLRRVGYVGEDAVAGYEREAAHQAFLRAQLADVEGAALALREVLAELHRSLRRRFDETFARVADAFAETFAVLFGGGSARLVLLEGGENGAREPGIDIVAQPPGKRLQSLALLSGGERALTAAALLFAILRVNPAPFCLLDEVDAALDEANIERFRDQLRALAGRTQVIVVTHNRGTIEAADTLYGVSMGADGVSQVLSLRLAEPAVGG